MAKVIGEEVFAIPAEAFAISPSNEGYTLCYSVLGDVWTEAGEATPAHENLCVKNSVNGLLYKLKGNNSTVYTKY